MLHIEYGSMGDDKWKEFDTGTIEQQTRMAIRNQTMAQDIVIRKYKDLIHWQD
jgi:hypothetical protein